MEQWAFEPKQEPKIDKFTYVYTHIYIYNCRKISVSCRAAATGSELLSPQRREWYDEPDLKSSSSAFKKRTHHVSHLLTSTFLHR